MARYLIEFRFLHVPTKRKIKGMIWNIDKRFRLRQAKRRRPVPHISLAGPLTTNSERRLIKDFHNVCSHFSLLSFKVRGFNTFEDNRVVYLDVVPSSKLKDFRWAISQKIRDYCYLKPHDLEKDFYFHTTLAMKLSPSKFRRVKSYVNNMIPINLDHKMVRATLIKNGKILVEYDFLQRKLLNRRQAKSKQGLRISGRLLEEFFKGTYAVSKNVKSYRN